jgi:CRISPR-associated protein Csx14
MARIDPKPALVATLGLQPQVITRSMDILLDDIEPDLGEAIIIHTSAFPFSHRYWRDLADFQEDMAKTYPKIQWRWVPIADAAGRVVDDVETPEAAELAFQIIYREVKRIKQQWRKVHGLIAGGRKSMIVFTMVSAQLLFGIEDRLWHLFSTDEGPDPHLPESRKHHSRLIEIPVMHLAGFMPVIHRMMLDSNDPLSAISVYREHEDNARLLRLREFFDSRDEIDQQILILAYRGYSNRQIADRVYIQEGGISRRVTSMADEFYEKVQPPPPSPYPGRIRLRLLHDMRALLEKLPPDD